MKTVFTNSEIVHTFNEQNQYEGKTSNNSMYFYNNKLYSYGSHYLLCEFIDNYTVIINDKGYSNTTSKHIGLITGATRNRKQFFTTKIETETVFNNVTEWLSKIIKARKTRQYYINQINNTFNMYFDYLEYTKQKTAKKKNKQHRQILKLYDNFINNLDNLEQQIKEQQKKEAIKNKKEIVKKVKDWKNLKINWFNNKTSNDFLRLKDNKIETSQGVKIPILEAKRLLKLIDSKSILGARVDNRYTVTAFNSLLKIGCHNIPLKEINYIKNLI